MSTELGTTSAVAESSADLEAVLEHLVAGRPIDAVLSRRVQETVRANDGRNCAANTGNSTLPSIWSVRSATSNELCPGRIRGGLKWVLPEADSDKRTGCGMILEIAFISCSPGLLPRGNCPRPDAQTTQKIIPAGYAKGFLADIMQTPPTLRPSLPLLARATDISSETRLGVYDSSMSLLQRENDAKSSQPICTVSVFPKDFPFVIPLSAFR